MRKRFRQIILLLALYTLLAASAVQAGSILSAYGMGEMVHVADARLRGMGGAGLALTEGTSGSLINPALLGGLKWAAVSCTARPEALYVKDDTQENVLTSVRIQNFALNLPLGKGLALGLDLRQLSDSKFKAYEETTLFDQVYTKSIVRTGGIHLASLSLARTFGSSLYLGVRAGHIFGKMTQAIAGDFADVDYRDTRVSSSIRNAGSLWSAGLALKLSGRLSAGAVFTPAYQVDQKETQTSSFSPALNKERSLTFPTTYGFGLAYRPSKNFMGQIDALLTRWSDFEISGQTVHSYTDVIRIALGGEYRTIREGTTSYLRKIALRFGYAMEPWYLKTAGGEKIIGHFLTLGIGLPFGRQGAHLDASLELGMRGNLSSIGAEEKIVRGTLSLWGFERWFQRKK